MPNAFPSPLFESLFNEFHKQFTIRMAFRPGQPAPPLNPQHLYHYTGSGAFLKILESQQLWASDVRQANDAKELQYAAELIAESAADLAKLGKLAPFESLQPRWPFRPEGEERPLGLPARFATSLTELDDDLAQWRAYCRPYGGVAIGLHADSVLSANYGFVQMAQCVYDVTRQREIVDRLLALLAPHYKLTSAFAPELLSLALAEVVEFVAPLLKHPAFSEEREWRIVLLRSHPRRRQPLRRRFRETLDGISTYVALACPRSDIKRVVVGPSPNAVANAASIADCVRSYGMDCEVVPSTVPHRAW